MFSCGANESGQLGRETPSPDPTRVTALAHTFVSKVACGSRHSVFLDENGYIYTCGSNSYKQCDPDAATEASIASRATPALVESLILDDLEVFDIFATQFATICVVNARRALRVLGLLAWPGAPWANSTSPIWASDDLIEFKDDTAGGSAASILGVSWYVPDGSHL